jgi:hypothetical protein
LVVEVEWQLSGLPNQTPEPYLIVPPEEVESLRSVWMVAATASDQAANTARLGAGFDQFRK